MSSSATDGAEQVTEVQPAPGDEAPGSRPKVSKLAVTALVTGVLPLAPVALVTGFAALAGIRRSGRSGHGMALAGLFFAAGWLIIGGAFGTVAGLTHGFQKPVRVVYHESAVFRLSAGQCIDTAGADSVTPVSCSGPHDGEVVGTFTLPGNAWPGTAAVRQRASLGCGDKLSAYLNPELAVSLSQAYVYPNEVDWNAGTRTVVCEVRAVRGQLTQSVRGAGGA